MDLKLSNGMVLDPPVITRAPQASFICMSLEKQPTQLPFFHSPGQKLNCLLNNTEYEGILDEFTETTILIVCLLIIVSLCQSFVIIFSALIFSASLLSETLVVKHHFQEEIKPKIAV